MDLLNNKLKKTVLELDRIAKMLIKRDFALHETREKLERSLEEFKLKNAEYQKNVSELESMNSLMVGREMRMIALKAEIERLKKQLAEKKPGN